MELLKQKIIEKGDVLPGNILKVDSFLNHQLDVELLNEIGKNFYTAFKDFNITKILTIESSGIAVACITAQYFKVPVLFAKKTASANTSQETYKADVYSYTRGSNYTIQVAKKFLSANDNVLILDDFLANGQAAAGAIKLLEQAGAGIAGIGIVIEKAFQGGRTLIDSKGVPVHSLAIVSSLENGAICFEQ